MCDYLAVGSDDDFVRVPLTPQTAQKIADRLGCVLPTRKLVDAIDRNADIQVEPHPLTERRESVATFVQHQQIIQSQCAGQPNGALITGIKKDVVLSPRILEPESFGHLRLAKIRRSTHSESDCDPRESIRGLQPWNPFDQEHRGNRGTLCQHSRTAKRRTALFAGQR